MFEVQGATVLISRGESASFDIVFGHQLEDTGNPTVQLPWEEIPENGTKIRFSVKVDSERPRPAIQKDMVVWNGFVTVPLESRDTKYLPFGEYTWDIRLFFENVDGDDPNTPVVPHPFYVTEAVGNV